MDPQAVIGWNRSRDNKKCSKDVATLEKNIPAMKKWLKMLGDPV